MPPKTRKTFIVHIIHPTGNLELTEEPVRFQLPPFREGTTDQQVLQFIQRNKLVYGFTGVAKTTNPERGNFEDVPKWDTSSCPVVDHEQTVICVVEDDGEGGAREIRRIKGPPVESTPQS